MLLLASGDWSYVTRTELMVADGTTAALSGREPMCSSTNRRRPRMLARAPEVPMDELPPVTPTMPPTRLVALADGVFAIVMTLLVFQLSIPVVAGEGSLADELVDMWPEFAVYVLSFLILGVFWLIHHVLFDLIERYDTTLIWLNVAFLMFASLVPFSTGLFANHGAAIATAVVYGFIMISVFGMGWAIFSYSTAGRRLVAPGIDPELVRGGKRMGLAYILFLVAAMAVSILSPVAAFVLYGVLVAAIITTTLIGRGEVALIWRPQTTPRSNARAGGGPSVSP